MQTQTAPSTGFLRQSQILGTIVPVGSSTLWRWVAAGKFPAPVKLSERVTAWRTADVQAWADAQRGEPQRQQAEA